MADLILWYLWTQAFAFGGWLIASRWLRRLPDSGYGVSKALGLLLGGFLYWWLVILGLSANNAGAVLMALAVVWCAGIALRATELRAGGAGPIVPRPALPVLITTELIYGLAFLGWAAYRSYTPEITQAGGEKFMEIMLVNAILRSPAFPPNDAWLSGFAISYYYFGYVILAMLVRASGIAPAVGFTLGGAMFFALTATGAFSVGYNLWALHRPAGAPSTPAPAPARRALAAPLVAGGITALMMGVMGNQGGLMEAANCAGAVPQSAWQWLNVRQIDQRQIECAGLAPTRFYWWWDWSRVVHDYTPAGDNQEAITEFPAFSFILGDNHPHVMSLPFVMLAIAFALSLYAGRGGAPAWLNLPLGAIVVGGLAFMNTWDFPVYGALAIGGLLLGRWLRREPLLPAIAFSAGLAGLGYALYLPFYATFSSQASGIGINLFNGTRWVQFALMFAPFLVAGAAYLWLTTRQVCRQAGLRARDVLGRALLLAAGGLVMIATFLAIIAVVSPQVRAVVSDVLNGGAVLGVSRPLVEQRLLARLTDPWVPLGALFAAALCAVLILAFRSRPATGPAASPDSPSPAPFVLLLFLGGAMLTAAVEFVFLRDMFGTRMNTIFKFYYQGWTVWAAASGFAVMALLANRGIAARAAGGVVIALMATGLLYPLFATQSRAAEHAGAPTLDGAAYLRNSQPDDARVIQWLNQNLAGAPVIIEAPADQYGAYQYNGRISAFTGLPAVLGWAGHQNQWRGAYTEPARREPAIETFFSTPDYAEALRIAREFGVQYAIVGPTERTRYPAEGLAKFDSSAELVFRSGDTTVYRIALPAQP